MIKRLIILLIFLSCKAPKQVEEIQNRTSVTYVPYNATLVCKNEDFVSNYKIQRSKNNKNWETIGDPIKPIYSKDSSIYKIALPKTSTVYYYRVLATMKSKATFNTVSIYLINTK